MAHLFQLRTPKGIPLESVIQEMSDEGWKVIQDFLVPDSNPSARQRMFYEEISRAMEPYVKAYDLCGTATMCSDEVEGGPWLSYDDKIFILNLPEGLDALVDNLAFVAMESTVDLLKANTRRSVFSKLQRAFHKNLSEHIYYNPVCRKSEFCKFSSSVSPWRHEWI